MQKFLVYISLLLLSLLPARVLAQPKVNYPANDGDKTSCKILIEMPKGYISGVCLLVHEGDSINGAVINEFGITALGFHYIISKDELKLEDVNAMIDKWYIKMVLHKDLRELLHSLKDGKLTYTNEKYHITYSLSPMDEDADGDNDSEETQGDGND